MALRNIRYLTFSGGGGKGLAYPGILFGLAEPLEPPYEDLKIFKYDEVKRDWIINFAQRDEKGVPVDKEGILGLSGTSIGGMFVGLLACGFGLNQIREICIKNEIYKKVVIDLYDELIGNNRKKIDFINNKNAYGDNNIYGENIAIGLTGNTYADLIIDYIIDQVQGTQSSGLLERSLPPLRMAKGLSKKVFQVYNDMGFLSGHDVWEYLSGEITKTFRNTNIRSNRKKILRQNRVTFKEQYEKNGLELVITGTDVASKKIYYFSYRTTPDMPIVDAIRVTISLPIAFKPIFVNDVHTSYGKTVSDKINAFIDGGALNNFPIRVFDIIDYEKLNINPEKYRDKYHLRGEVNPDVLGFTLSENTPNSDSDVFDVALNTLLNLSVSKTVKRQVGDINEDVYIINCDISGLSMIDFNAGAEERFNKILDNNRELIKKKRMDLNDKHFYQ